jgi:glycosyltransferase involved in cell wall biosynthesis
MYEYEGISVIEGDNKTLIHFMNQNHKMYDLVLIHFINIEMIKTLFQLNYKLNLLVFIHGYEALAWYRRLFDININFYKYIFKNTIQLASLRKFIKFSNHNVNFIFVSEWMKNITEKDTQTTINKYYIIPNPVNNDMFNFSRKTEEHRKKILSIRPYSSKKYANDLTIDAIIKLSKKEYFNDLYFELYGQGKLFSTLTSKVKNFKNVKVFNKFLSQEEIAKKHKEFGIFLCPTRQDSQGVSMCEAMSSGLVPITSNNTAIPEFVYHNYSGILTNNVDEIADWIENLYLNTDKFLQLSYNASTTITDICGKNYITAKEIDIMRKLIKENRYHRLNNRNPEIVIRVS